MFVLKALLVIVLVIISILLVGLILMQKSKSGGGLGGAFGGGMTESILGSRAGNFLSRSTAVLGIAFAVIVLALGLLNRTQRSVPGINQGAPPATAPATAPEGG